MMATLTSSRASLIAIQLLFPCPKGIHAYCCCSVKLSGENLQKKDTSIKIQWTLDSSSHVLVTSLDQMWSSSELNRINQLPPWISLSELQRLKWDTKWMHADSLSYEARIGQLVKSLDLQSIDRSFQSHYLRGGFFVWAFSEPLNLNC